jgi:hypothetical protein
MTPSIPGYPESRSVRRGSRLMLADLAGPVCRHTSFDEETVFSPERVCRLGVRFSGMDLGTRRTYYNRCHPSDTLDPGDDRYVDIDAIDPAHPVRGQDWVTRLADRIELSDRPVYELFTGLPGSGKSTELRRLVQRLQSRQPAP